MTSRWNANGRHHGGFPTSVKKQAERTLPKVCAHCGTHNGPFNLDHRVNAAEGGSHHISNAQWLCQPCHDDKTQHEAARGRARRSRFRPPEAHPGLT